MVSPNFHEIVDAFHLYFLIGSEGSQDLSFSFFCPIIYIV